MSTIEQSKQGDWKTQVFLHTFNSCHWRAELRDVQSGRSNGIKGGLENSSFSHTSNSFLLLKTNVILTLDVKGSTSVGCVTQIILCDAPIQSRIIP